MLTRNGIELNIEESNYKLSYNDLVFYFSSMFYLHKFEKEISFFVESESKKLYNKFKVQTDLSNFLAIALYHKIEKRGFKVLYKDKEPVKKKHLKPKM